MIDIENTNALGHKQMGHRGPKSPTHSSYRSLVLGSREFLKGDGWTGIGCWGDASLWSRRRFKGHLANDRYAIIARESKLRATVLRTPTEEILRRIDSQRSEFETSFAGVEKF